MRPLRQREQMLLGGLGLLALVAAFYLLLYSPKTSEAAALIRQIEAQRTDVVRLEKEKGREKELEREIADLQSAIEVRDAKLPSAREIPQLLLQVDELAGQTGVTVTSVKPGALQAVTARTGTSAGLPRKAGAAAPATSMSRAPEGSEPETINYQRFTIDLETKGTFSATLGFVRGLENSLRFLTLSDIRVILAPPAREDNPEDPVLSLHITGTGYVRLEGEKIP